MQGAQKLQSIFKFFENNEKDSKLEALKYRSGGGTLANSSQQEPHKCFPAFDKDALDMGKYPEAQEYKNISTASEKDRFTIMPKSCDEGSGEDKLIVFQKMNSKIRRSPKKLWRKPKFEYIFPESFAKDLNTTPQFEFVRKLAIRLFQRRFHDQLHIISATQECSVETENENPIESLFSWDCKKFYYRHNLPPFWMNLVKINNSPDQLEDLKKNLDMQELKSYFNQIIKAIYLETCKEVPNIFKEAVSFLDIHKTIRKQHKKTAEILSSMNNFDIDYEETSTDDNTDIQFLETELTDQTALCPIETRYQRNWFRIKSDQYKLRFKREEEKLAKEIIEYRNEMERENVASKNSLNEFYGEIETYKVRFNNLTTQFEIEEEDWENKNSYVRSKIEKVKEQKKFQIDEIARFYEEIEKLRIKEAEQKEKEEREALEAEAKKALTKKSKRKDGKAEKVPKK